MDRPTDSRINFSAVHRVSSLPVAFHVLDFHAAASCSPVEALNDLDPHTGLPPHSGSDSIRQSPPSRSANRFYTSTFGRYRFDQSCYGFDPFHLRKGNINLIWREHLSKSSPPPFSASRLFSLGIFRRPAVTSSHCYPRLSTRSKQIALLINPHPYSTRILKPSTCLAEVSVLSSTMRST